jgi:NAD(P)-dependent dehydrogenase (short-subunit alcohol dehydrogenase family)
MDNNMKDQVVLITGASGGIGSVMAVQFADANAKVILHYNSQQEKAESLCKELKGKGHITFGGDLTNPNAIDKIVAQSLSAFGRIDILVNNAGIYFEHPIDKIDFTEWQSAWNKSINTNLIGPANLTFRVAKEMIKHGGGKIINISSRGAFRGEPTAPAYGAGKAGLNSMGQSLAIALAPHNIFVYTIAPGFVETAMARPHLTGDRKKEILNQSPIGRVAKPEEIAKTAVFLASEGTDFLTGCIIDVNGASYLRS